MPKRRVTQPAGSAKVLRCIDCDDFAAIQATAQLPAGPSTLQELIAWPLDIVNRAERSREGLTRVAQLLIHGLLVTGDYSGYECPREMITQVWKVLADKGIVDKSTCRFSRSCDNDNLPLHVLKYLSEVVDGNDSCIFTDIENCVTEATQEAMDKMIPHQGEKELSKDQIEEIKAAYQVLLDWLITNRHTAFKEHCASHCIVHDRECPGYARMMGQHVDCLRINTAGTTCVGWSSVGKSERFAHTSERVHAVWLVQRIILAETLKEDGFMQDSLFVCVIIIVFSDQCHLIRQECTRFYPTAEKLQRPLRFTHRVVWVRVCGTDLGYPSKRDRVVSWNLNNLRLHWIGPEDQPSIQEDFNNLFHRRIVLNGDIYCQAPSDYVKSVYKGMMAKHKFYVSDDEIPIRGRAILNQMLTPAQCTRLREYNELFEQGGFYPGSENRLIADGLQWPGSAGDTSGVLFPSQLKHGCYYSFGARRLVMGREFMFANGFNVFEEPGSPFSSNLTPLLETLKENQLKALSGNGMMLPAMGCWFLYAMMNTVRIESPKITKEHTLASEAIRLEDAEAEEGEED